MLDHIKSETSKSLSDVIPPKPSAAQRDSRIFESSVCFEYRTL